MSTILLLFLIAALGYLLGSIHVKGLHLGTSGVLIIALIFGHFNFEIPSIIRDFGLVSFVTSVGFIAGPRFFRNFRKKAVPFVVLGLSVIISGAVLCALIIKFAGVSTALGVGMMAGALTSTPGLAAAIEASGSDIASVGYGIAYPFGVVGVVLFVQLMPKLLGVDIPAELARMQAADEAAGEASAGKAKKDVITLDDFGMFPFCTAVILGLLLAKISFPLPGGTHFSLGTSGGPLLAGLIMGHFAAIGRVSISVPKPTLDVLREVGLALFLLGAGTSAGKGFVEILKTHGVILFLLGAIMTLIPMIIGYFVSRKIFSIDILSSLGGICGGMTSTPALGTLISMTKSDLVAASYAVTYPVALIAIVLCCEFIPLLL